MIVPTLCVGMQPVTLCVTGANGRDAERLKRHSHAERGNDHAWRTIKKGPRMARPFSGSIVSTLRPHRLRHAEHE
ncbi:hypothetical protein C1X27_07190 [Pseudomonas sp. MPR-AND1B]|nr:hypothetical protein C1X26_03400 [Pseudomonas sp. MPR-R3A]PMY99477.1 hypothetical protein C1X24_03580 [Pseudomonas sp. FW305-124]PMZ73005.1 hypothetical protein C1X25_10375 [Pseudomonas sp. GW247-3R2A]PNA94898.1 hypothetical protein C1X23_06910 [Pseudomonas sp. FW300-E2]PNB03947.1 hypothetical protein C1X27_07190 [Pseudomonas sp. MPR-AND1B]POH40342.1 hypothetical protein C2U56_16635 [Pseudomonas fluorescens]PTT09562.1 hypothetical protein DBR14_18705 [Pseudomonas sp. HMWF034]PVV71156.1 hy